MAEFLIETTLHAYALGSVELSCEWNDVAKFYIKWDTLFYQRKGRDEWEEAALNSNLDDGVDWKRPTGVAVYTPDWDRLASQ